VISEVTFFIRIKLTEIGRKKNRPYRRTENGGLPDTDRQSSEQEQIQYPELSRGLLIFSQKRNSVSRNTFLATDKSKFFVCGCFYGNIVGRETGDGGEGFLHLVDVWLDAGLFKYQRTIDVTNAVPLTANQFYNALQQYAAINGFEFCGSIGKLVTYVAQTGGAKQCIADGMNQHIGVGMAVRTFVVRYFDTSQNAGATFTKLMDVESKANADFHHSPVSSAFFSELKSKMSVKRSVFSSGLR
jgi:hypothetical protein